MIRINQFRFSSAQPASLKRECSAYPVYRRLLLWIPSLVAIAAVTIFVGAVFPYLSKSGKPIGWGPMLIGLVLTALIVGWCTCLSIPAENRPVENGPWVIVSIAVVLSIIVYTALFFLLVLNVVGS